MTYGEQRKKSVYRTRKKKHAVRVVFAVVLLLAVLLCLWAAQAGPALGGNRMKGANGVSLIDVPYLSQLPEFPTGCESVSAVMALQYYGLDITPGDFVDSYLSQGTAPHLGESGVLVGCDPYKAFPGDPRSESGWGCFPPVITTALEQAAGGQFEVRELTGETVEELCRSYVDRGTPVLLWVTINMEPAVEGDTWLLEDSGEPFTWIEPMHCAVLVGRDGGSYYFNDPLAGKGTPYSREAVEAAYQAMGSQAIVLLPR